MAEHGAVQIREARAEELGPGFCRLPDRDYEYAPGHRLFAFGMPLAGG